MGYLGYLKEREQLPPKTEATALVYIAFTKYGVTEVFSGFLQCPFAIYSYLYEKSRGKLEIGTKIISSAFSSQEDRQRYLELFSPITDYTYIRNVQDNWAEFDNLVIPEGTEDGKYCNNKVPPYDVCSYPLTHMLVHSNCRPFGHVFQHSVGHRLKTYLKYVAVTPIKFSKIKHPGYRYVGCAPGVRRCQRAHGIGTDLLRTGAGIHNR